MSTNPREFFGSVFSAFRRKKPAPTEQRGAPGTAVRGGWVDEHEKDSRLQGEEKWRTYADIVANVSIAAASIRYYLSLVAQPRWKVEPPEDGGDEAKRIADVVQGIMDDMATPWKRVVRRSAMYKFHGFSIQEWIAKRMDDGTLGFADIEPRPQATITRWDSDRGKVSGMTQTDPETAQELYLPRGKVIYLVDDSLSDSPLGFGILRHFAEPGLRLQRFQVLEAFGHETDLRGIPLARAPLAELKKQVDQGKLTKKDKEDAEKPLRDFIKAHIKNPELGLLLDSMTYRSRDESASPSSVYHWDLELVRGDGTGGAQESVGKSIERITREMARITGTEFLLLGSDGKGSLALSKDKTEMFLLLVNGALEEIAETYEADFLDPLFALNGWDEKLKPELSTESIQFRDVEQITAALRDMAQAGALLAPDDPAIEAVRTLLGLPKPIVLDGVLDSMLRGEGGEGGAPGERRNGDESPDDVPEGRDEEQTTT